MAISKIRRGNRITIPHDIMVQKDLHVGDEIYYEIVGVVGRDVFASRSSAANNYGTDNWDYDVSSTYSSTIPGGTL